MPAHHSPLASAGRLPDRVQEALWRRGSNATRARIAGRADLSEALSAAVVASADDTCLQSWLSVPRRPADLLATAAAGPLTDQAAQLLASQLHAPQDVLDMLIQRGSPMVASVLLLRRDLDAQQRSACAATYVSGRVRVGWAEVQSVVDHVGTSIDAWLAAVRAAPRGASSIPFAAVVAARDDTAVHGVVLDWWESNRPRPASDQESDRERCFAKLLTSPHLTPANAGRAARLTADPLVRQRADALAAMDVPGWLADAAAGSVDAMTLRGVAEAVGLSVAVPGAGVIDAYYRDPCDLPPDADRALSAIARSVGPDDAAAILDTLVRAGRLVDAHDLITRLSSYTALESMAHVDALVGYLCAVGDPTLLRSSAATAHADTLADAYRPLAAALSIPAVAASVVARIDRLAGHDTAVLETALALADDWQGTSGELMHAAEVLTHDHPAT